MSGRGRGRSRATASTRVLCVNCNICVNTLRRYPALHLNPRVNALLTSWVYPQDINVDDYVCEACRDLLISAVNATLEQDVSGNESEQAGPSQRGHTHVCLLCGCSIMQRQSDKILRESPSELQQSMIDIIKSRVAPRQVTATDRVCHACWLRTQREVRRMNQIDTARLEPVSIDTEDLQEEQESSRVTEQIPDNIEDQSVSQPVTVPGYRRAANSNRRCVCSVNALQG